MSRVPRIAVVADVNNNLVDGSVVWLRNTLLALTDDASRQHVTLLLREDPLASGVLFPPGIRFPGCDVLTPSELSGIDTTPCSALSAERLSLLIGLVEARFGAFDTVFVRGTAFATALLQSERLRKRTVVYTTERPNFAGLTPTPFERALVEHAKHIFVQSPVQKRYYEVYLQAGPGRITEFPPMVTLPGSEGGGVARLASEKRQVVSYAGKLDANYCVEELLDLSPELSAAGFAVEVVGGKFNRSEKDPQFVNRLAHKLRESGVTWLGSVAHDEAQSRMREVRFGYCLRAPELDDSIEISTKLLEYSAQGTPPILRRTRQHESLFGADYPYYVSTPRDVVALLRSAVAPDQRYQDAVARVIGVARQFDIRGSAARLEPLRRVELSLASDQAAQASRRRLLVATHDDKFLRAALDRLREQPGLEIRYQRWRSQRTAPQEGPQQHADWADVVFCEWCCEQAVWWSRNKAPGQRLIVRLHRFEAFEPYPRHVDWSAVDALVVVSDYFRDLAVTEFGVPAAIIHVLPQYVDLSEFDRPKLDRAARTVGMVGINALAHKRPDRAIDFIERLVARDDRFSLRIRSRLPWEYRWVWVDRPHERRVFSDLFRRCLESPLSRYVHFDRAGSDMGEWFRSVSLVVSTSDTEGCHTSVAEGMAAGCWPLCYAWPGAASVYGSDFVHADVDAMVEAALEGAARLEAEGATAIKKKAARFGIEASTEYFCKLIQ